MGDWYSIGVFAGLGVALGVACAGVFGGRRYAFAAPFLAAVIGVALGIALADAPEAAAAGLGGVLGGVGALELVRGALGRGGTPLATALLVLGAAVVVAGLAFVPSRRLRRARGGSRPGHAPAQARRASATRVSARSPGIRACPRSSS